MKKKHLFYTFIIIFLLILIFPKIITAEDYDISINRWITDNTHTKIGRKFFDHFTKYWSPPANIEEYNITIIERTSARWGVRMTVKAGSLLNQKIVYRKMLSPRSKEVEKAARESIKYVKHYLLKTHKKGNPNDSRDLSGNGLQ